MSNWEEKVDTVTSTLTSAAGPAEYSYVPPEGGVYAEKNMYTNSFK